MIKTAATRHEDLFSISLWVSTGTNYYIDECCWYVLSGRMQLQLCTCPHPYVDGHRGSATMPFTEIRVGLRTPIRRAITIHRYKYELYLYSWSWYTLHTNGHSKPYGGLMYSGQLGSWTIGRAAFTAHVYTGSSAPSNIIIVN